MGGRPKPPDPRQTADIQQGYNREAMRDAAQYGQIGQQTPWGSIRYEGAIGSPDRQQIVELNPADQQALDARRGISQGLLSIMTGTQPGAGMPGAGAGTAGTNKAGRPGMPPAPEGMYKPGTSGNFQDQMAKQLPLMDKARRGMM